MDTEYLNAYLPKLKLYFEKLDGLNLLGIPEPHLPNFGSKYFKAKPKIMFMGMETKGWGDHEKLKAILTQGKEEMIEYFFGEFRRHEFLKWRNNFGRAFWDFVLEALASFNDIPSKKELESSRENILSSFAWANVNSIERYQVTCEDNGVEKSVYDKVKDASKIFDDFKFILDTLTPDVVIITHWSFDLDYFQNAGYKDPPVNLGDHLQKINLEGTKCQVYKTAHPGWLYRNNLVHQIIATIKEDVSKTLSLKVEFQP
jgi:hypothetical protein